MFFLLVVNINFRKKRNEFTIIWYLDELDVCGVIFDVWWCYLFPIQHLFQQNKKKLTFFYLIFNFRYLFVIVVLDVYESTIIIIRFSSFFCCCSFAWLTHLYYQHHQQRQQHLSTFRIIEPSQEFLVFSLQTNHSENTEREREVFLKLN